MRHGDISNKSAPTIAFRVEDLIVRYHEPNTFSRLIVSRINPVKERRKRAYLDPHMLYMLSRIFRDTNLTSDLVIAKDCVDCEWIIEDLLKVYVPHAHIHIVEKPTEITSLIYRGDFMYYVDPIPERASLVNHRACITVYEANVMIQKEVLNV